MDGDTYFESVNCGANLGHMTFHAWVFRKIYGKLGMIVVAGAPKLAKTKVRIVYAPNRNNERNKYIRKYGPVYTWHHLWTTSSLERYVNYMLHIVNLAQKNKGANYIFAN